MMNTNRTFQIYRNSFWIQIYSEKDYEDNIEDYPHFKLWQKLLNYFKNRDFKIGVNKHVYKHYKILSKNYKKPCLPNSFKWSLQVTNCYRHRTIEPWSGGL